MKMLLIEIKKKLLVLDLVANLYNYTDLWFDFCDLQKSSENNNEGSILKSYFKRTNPNFHIIYQYNILTASSDGFHGRPSLKWRTCDMCRPRLRWTLQHSSQIKTPRLMEAHSGPMIMISRIKANHILKKGIGKEVCQIHVQISLHSRILRKYQSQNPVNTENSIPEWNILYSWISKTEMGESRIFPGALQLLHFLSTIVI